MKIAVGLLLAVQFMFGKEAAHTHLMGRDVGVCIIESPKEISCYLNRAVTCYIIPESGPVYGTVGRCANRDSELPIITHHDYIELPIAKAPIDELKKGGQ